MFHSFALAFICAANFSFIAKADYVVKEGDWIVEITRKQMAAPQAIYGPHGRIEILRELNPQIKNIDLILPGQKLNLPTREIASDATAPPEEVPISAPTPDDVSLSGDDSNDYKVGLKLQQVFSRIDALDLATGGQAYFVSDLMTDVEISYEQILNPKTQEKSSVFYQIGWRGNRYLDPAVDQKVSAVETSTRIAADYRKHFSSSFNASLGGGVEQLLFSRALNTSEFVLENLAVPFLKVALGYTKYFTPRRRLEAHFYFQNFFNSTGGVQDSKSGRGYGAILSLPNEVRNYEISPDIFWHHGNYDSQLVEQEKSSLGIGISLRWRL